MPCLSIPFVPGSWLNDFAHRSLPEGILGERSGFGLELGVDSGAPSAGDLGDDPPLLRPSYWGERGEGGGELALAIVDSEAAVRSKFTFITLFAPILPGLDGQDA